MSRIDLIVDKELEDEKRECIKIARDLRYDEKVIEKIAKTKTPCELSRVMKTARISDD